MDVAFADAVVIFVVLAGGHRYSGVCYPLTFRALPQMYHAFSKLSQRAIDSDEFVCVED